MITTIHQSQTQQKGSHFEKLAKKFLKKKGLTFIESNFHSRFGEIDLVFTISTTLVFTEVRYRQSSFFGTATETVTTRKQHKIRMTAGWYLQQHPEYSDYFCRFDVLGITLKHHKPDYHWIPGAF